MFKINDMKFNLKNIDRALLKKWLLKTLFMVLFFMSLILSFILLTTPFVKKIPDQGERILFNVLGVFSFIIVLFSLKHLWPNFLLNTLFVKLFHKKNISKNSNATLTIKKSLEIIFNRLKEKFKNINKGKWIKILKPIILILVIILLISLIIFLYNYYYGGKVRLITVNKDLPVSHILTNDDLNFEYLDFDLVPTSTITEKNKIIGQATIFPLSKGEIITHKYLNSKINPETLATLVPYGKFGLMLNSDLFSAPLPKIEVNDFITIIDSAAFENNKDGILISDKVYFVEYGETGNPKSFFLALTSEEIETINMSKLARGSLILIVNSHD